MPAVQVILTRDHLTEQNVDVVLRTMKNEDTSFDRHQGLVPAVTDFHCKNEFQ